MNGNTIFIEWPRVVENGDCVRLEADVTMSIDGCIKAESFFFEVEKKWGEYFLSELSDPFILALIELAMENGCDIAYEAPMSEDLKYQLERYFIPVYSRKLEPFKRILLVGETSNSTIKSLNAVGTGFSGGVDSFYTVLTHMDIPYESKRVTHVMFALNGAADSGVTEEIDQKWFTEERARFSSIVNDLGLEFVAVNSNVSRVNDYKKYLLGGSPVLTSSFVHALRKLFGTYYWASGYEADVLKFTTGDSCFMEPFTIPLVSVSGLRFYHSGCEANRVEKVERIAGESIVQRALTVCGKPDSCGLCPKCLRTMAELSSIGRLDDFKAVFDVNDYKKNYRKRLAREFAIDHPPFTTDIKRSMVEHGKGVSPTVIILANLIYRPYYFLKRILRNNRIAMDLYYNQGWAERLGESPDPEMAKARLEGKGKLA